MVRQRDSGQIFAMKMLHKWEMLKRAEVSLGSGGTLAPYKWAGAGVASEATGRAGEGVVMAAEQTEDSSLIAAHSPIPSSQLALLRSKQSCYHFPYDNTEAQSHRAWAWAHTGDLDLSF